MSINFKKEGLSVADVAGFLHCTPATVRRYIMTGALGAHLSSKEVIPGTRRNIRIMPEHLKEFMRKHPERFDETLLRKFGVTAETETEPDVEPESDAPIEIHGPVTGEQMLADPRVYQAVVDGFARAGSAKIDQKETEQHSGRYTWGAGESCRIMIDGRIAVANITKKTAAMCVSALLNDPLIGFADVRIEIQ